MSRAYIYFLPDKNSDSYAMPYVDIVDKYEGWEYDTSGFRDSGNIVTDNLTTDVINTTYWFKMKPVEGYKFTDVHKTNSAATANEGNFEIAEDGSVTVYPWVTGTSYSIRNYLYVAVAEDTGDGELVTIEKNLQNCSGDVPETVAKGASVSITLTANENYTFRDTDKPSVTISDTTHTFTLSEDKKSATIDCVASSDMVINAVAVGATYTLTTNLEYVYCNFENEIPSGDVTIKLATWEGFIFSGSVKVLTESNHITHVYSDFTEGGTVCEINMNVTGAVTITASAVRKPEQISTFANLYRVTNDQLNDLSKVRFVTIEGETVDYGSFISNLYRLPFQLPESTEYEQGSIQLGNYDSKVVADVLMNYVLVVDIGTIHVPEKYHNIYDYKDTTCILHLPYCENVEIPTEYVVNHNLTVEYRIDLYNGTCTANIRSNFLNEVVVSKTFTIGTKIPFIQQKTNSVVGEIGEVIHNNVKTAFVEVVRNIPYNMDTIFGSETVDFGTLENYDGYIEVSNIILNISATNDEKDEIERLLKNGVFINGGSVNEESN